MSTAPTTDCAYCHRPVVEMADGRWEHYVPDEDSARGFYTHLTCDPLLFDDKRHRVATPTTTTTGG